MNKNSVIAFDLDGTLIDSSHRWRGCIHDWVKNCTPEKVMQDTLLPLTEIYHLLKEDGYSLIAVTARVMSDADYYFLQKHDLIFEEVLERGGSDESDHFLKYNLLQDYFSRNEGKKPLLAFDDKPENLKIFEMFGFKTYHPDVFNN